MKNHSGLNTNVRLHIRDGSSQTDRLLPALTPHYFELIDLRFHTLLAMAVDYAEKMKFYNLKLQVEGDWKPYFSADETVLIATMLSTDRNRLVTLFKHRQYRVQNRPEAVRLLRERLPATHRNQLIANYCVIEIIDHWLETLQFAATRTGQELHQLIGGILVGLGNDIRQFTSYLKRDLPEKPLSVFFSAGLIALLELENTQTRYASETETTRAADAANLRARFHALIKAVEMIQTRAANVLPATLHNQRHDPATGLLIAFVRLFQRLHHKINRFTSDYIDFYYQQVLGVQPHAFVRDHVYLVARPSNIKQRIRIPKGTVFAAKQPDSAGEIHFHSEQDVCVHGAAVGTVYTLFFNRDPLNSPENALKETLPGFEAGQSPGRQLVTGCWINSVEPFTEETLQQGEHPLASPVFGAPKDVESESYSAEHARMGFALASNVLWLKEGSRRVVVTLQFTDANEYAGWKTLRHWIQDIAAALKSPTESPADNAEATQYAAEQEQDIFYKVFSNLFAISLTVETGWLAIDEYVPSYAGVDDSMDENSLRLVFSLSPDAPVVTPYDRQLHGGGLDVRLPVVQFTLNPHGYLYPYGILNRLALDAIQIDVSVSGYRTVQLHNQLGQLSAQTAFNPFGPLPEVGAYLLVGCAEAAQKQLTGFSVDIQWGGLPAGLGGFRSYYSGYDGPSEHTDFKISKSIFSDGKWFPEQIKPSDAEPMFEIQDGSYAFNTLRDTIRLTCDSLLRYRSVPERRSSAAISTNTNVQHSGDKGFLKFTLVEPADAFGHKKYPQVLARVLTHNTRQGMRKTLKPEPNAPYTPLIESVQVNYRATTRISSRQQQNANRVNERDQLIHLHPLGWKAPVLQSGQGTALLPRYLFSGNLFIGLNEFESGQELTLYFHLRENALPSEYAVRQTLHWFYLSSNNWKPLAPHQVISDGTQGFMTSGIVTLDVPADINRDNTIMPDTQCWLRVCAEHDLEKFCSLYAIYAQGIKVIRSVNNGDGSDGTVPATYTPLPAGSIKQAKQSIKGLDSVWQVQMSMGGRAAEDNTRLRIRVSERLRHKNRAVTPTDFEQIILEHFPQIYKVKCFAGLLPRYDESGRHVTPWLHPGHVTIALLPFPDYPAHHDKQRWISGHLVDDVNDYIARHISPFVTLHFVNPVYETVQVRCTVKFKHQRTTGMLLGQLNEAVSAYLSPWHTAVGYTTHFGWRITCHDVQSYIQQLDFIDRVTNFSILRITPKGGALFGLTDSAATDGRDPLGNEIKPRYPWSITAPMRRHFIEVDDRFDTIKPQVTGIGELEIGSTLIIADHGPSPE